MSTHARTYIHSYVLTRYFIDTGAAHASIRGLIATEFKSGDFFGEIAFVATCKKILGDNKDKGQSRCLTLRQADVVRVL